MTITYEFLIKQLNSIPKEKINIGLSKKLKEHMLTFFKNSKIELDKLSKNLEKDDVNNLRSVLKIKKFDVSLKMYKKKKVSYKKKKKVSYKKKKKVSYKKKKALDKQNISGGTYSNEGENINTGDDLFEYLNVTEFGSEDSNNSYSTFFSSSLDEISPYQFGVVFISLYHYFVALLLNIKTWCKQNLTISNFRIQKEAIVKSTIYKFLSKLIYFLRKTIAFIWWVLNLPIIGYLTTRFATLCLIYYYRIEILNVIWYYVEEPLMYFLQSIITDAIREHVIYIAREAAIDAGKKAAIKAGTEIAHQTIQQAQQFAITAGTEAGKEAAKAIANQALQQAQTLAITAGTEAATQAASAIANQALQQAQTLAITAGTEAATQTATAIAQQTLQQAQTLAISAGTDAATQAASAIANQALQQAQQLAITAGTEAATQAATAIAHQAQQQVITLATNIASETAAQIALQTGEELSKEALRVAINAAIEAATKTAISVTQKAITDAATESARNKLISTASITAIKAALANYFPEGLLAAEGLGAIGQLALGQ